MSAPSNGRKAAIEAAAEKPLPPPVETAAIPESLKLLPRWVCWRYERRAGKDGTGRWTKLPINPNNGQTASSTNPGSWGSFDEAQWRCRGGSCDGIGFVFATEDGLAGIDLDDCRDPATGELDGWAVAVVQALDSYTEVSPSGTGVKVFVQGTVPLSGNRKGKIEVYSSGRYFTMTGAHLPGTPTIVNPRQAALAQLHAQLFNRAAPSLERPASTNAVTAQLGDADLIRRASQVTNGAKFRKLWAGDLAGYPSASEADLALCQLLAFWTGPDPIRLDALFRQSGLIRPKWDERRGDQSYGQRTIAQALTHQKEYFTPMNPTRPKSSCSAPHPPKEPRRLSVSEYKPFPTDALPSPIREFVIEGAAALGCDPAFIALPTLAVAAAMIGYSRVIQLKRSWREPCVLWTLIVGESGTLKSPAYRLATDPLYSIQQKLDQQYKEDRARYEEAVAKCKSAKKNDNQEATLLEEIPKEPVERIIFSTDTTIEALAEMIGDNPRGLLVTCDELGAWFSMFSRYSSGKGGVSDLPRWLSMHSAGGFSYHRKTGDRRRITVSHAAVSVTGGIQPGVLKRAMTPDFRESGLAARLLLAMPRRQPKRWSEAEISPEIETAYHELLEKLLELQFAFRDGSPAPQILRLSPAAKQRWIAFYNAWGRKQTGAQGDLAAAFSKLEGCAARFALLHHVVSRSAKGERDHDLVEIESVEAGTTLCNWFANEAERIYAAMGESEEQNELRQVVEFIRGYGARITIRQLQKSNSRKYPSAEDARVALQSVADAGLGAWEGGEPPRHGGHRIRHLVLRPTPDTSDARLEAEQFAEEPLPDARAEFGHPTTDSPGESEQVSEVSGVGNGPELSAETVTEGEETEPVAASTVCSPFRNDDTEEEVEWTG